jgi:hypothetical protein
MINPSHNLWRPHVLKWPTYIDDNGDVSFLLLLFQIVPASYAAAAPKRLRVVFPTFLTACRLNYETQRPWTAMSKTPAVSTA